MGLIYNNIILMYNFKILFLEIQVFQLIIFSRTDDFPRTVSSGRIRPTPTDTGFSRKDS